MPLGGQTLPCLSRVFAVSSPCLRLPGEANLLSPPYSPHHRFFGGGAVYGH